MKLRHILANIDKSEKNTDYINVERLAGEFGIHDFINIPDDFKIKCYFFLNWYCTDTFVGGRAYFLNVI